MKAYFFSFILLFLFCLSSAQAQNFLFQQSGKTKVRTAPEKVIYVPDARIIPPNDIDPSITQNLKNHVVMMPDAPQSELLVWLAGTTAPPEYYMEFMKTARDLGFHVIGLSYDNRIATLQVCLMESDPNCAEDYRLEKITGKDYSARAQVNPNDAIEPRLKKVLNYLSEKYSSENWSRFLSGNAVNWSKITISGHSQGAGHAAKIAQMYKVDRAVMFSSPGDFNRTTRKPASWTSEAFATSSDRLYGLCHASEHNQKFHLMHWKAMGMESFGKPAMIDNASPPYGNSHILITDIEPMVNNHHVAPIGDIELQRLSNEEPVMRKTWGYMLTGKQSLPTYVYDGEWTAYTPTHVQQIESSPSRPAQTRNASNRSAMLFQRFDRNRDGLLSKSEIPKQLKRLHQGFKIIDRNNDGKLAPEEFSFGEENRTRNGMPTSQVVQKPQTSEGGYIDPEILSSENLLAYQDSLERIWLEVLEGKSGLHLSDPSDRILVDTDAARIFDTWNGPEFGVDKNGWRLYYTKSVDGVYQIWEALVQNGASKTKAITHDNKRRQSILVSKNTKAGSIRLAYLNGSKSGGTFYWMDTKNPQKEHKVVKLNGKDSPRWIDETFTLVFAESEGRAAGQLKLYDTQTGRMKTITNDAGVKSFAYGWIAPDFKNDLLVLAMVDNQRIGVWRDPGHDGPWPRITTIHKPKEARYLYMGSPEPFVFNGKSYMSLVIKEKTAGQMFRDSEVWVFGLNSNGSVNAQRVDSDGYNQWMRSDPETYITDNEAFVFYSGYKRAEGHKIYKTKMR